MPSYVLFTLASLIWGSTYRAITLAAGRRPARRVRGLPPVPRRTWSAGAAAVAGVAVCLGSVAWALRPPPAKPAQALNLDTLPDTP